MFFSALEDSDQHELELGTNVALCENVSFSEIKTKLKQDSNTGGEPAIAGRSNFIYMAYFTQPQLEGSQTLINSFLCPFRRSPFLANV